MYTPVNFFDVQATDHPTQLSVARTNARAVRLPRSSDCADCSQVSRGHCVISALYEIVRAVLRIALDGATHHGCFSQDTGRVCIAVTLAAWPFHKDSCQITHTVLCWVWCSLRDDATRERSEPYISQFCISIRSRFLREKSLVTECLNVIEISEYGTLSQLHLLAGRQSGISFGSILPGASQSALSRELSPSGPRASMESDRQPFRTITIGGRQLPG